MQQQPSAAARRFDLSGLQVRRAEALQSQGRHDEAIDAATDAVLQVGMAVAADSANAYWQAQQAHTQAIAAAVVTRAGKKAPGPMAPLRQTVAQALQQRPNDATWNQAALVLQVVQAVRLLAAAPDSDATAHAADAALQALEQRLAANSPTWQVYDLAAWLALTRLNAAQPWGAGGSAEIARQRWCERIRQILQPAVAAGQAGVVLEAWLVTQACPVARQHGMAGPAELTAGGYQPIYADVSR